MANDKTDRTEADVEQTKAAVANTENKRVGKVHVAQLASGKWEAEIEYVDDQGKTTNGETQEFDEFSDASAWVASIEVDAREGNPLKAPPVDHTEDM